nr:hypothetical protein [Tanacetum cinerariifolium]
TLLAKKESDLKAYGGIKEGVPLVILSRIRLRRATGHSVPNQAMSTENVGSGSVHNEVIETVRVSTAELDSGMGSCLKDILKIERWNTVNAIGLLFLMEMCSSQL